MGKLRKEMISKDNLLDSDKIYLGYPFKKEVKEMSEVIAIANQKGGVGKTMTAVSIKAWKNNLSVNTEALR